MMARRFGPMNTGPGDLVLIHHRGSPVGYARLEEITADVKPGWWQVRLLLLQVPAKEVVWILREEYIDGKEFSMGGEPMCLERIPLRREGPQPPGPGPEKDKPRETAASKKGKVVVLSERKR
jgi:hypothetical protein